MIGHNCNVMDAVMNGWFLFNAVAILWCSVNVNSLPSKTRMLNWEKRIIYVHFLSTELVNLCRRPIEQRLNLKLRQTELFGNQFDYIHSIRIPLLQVDISQFADILIFRAVPCFSFYRLSMKWKLRASLTEKMKRLNAHDQRGWSRASHKIINSSVKRPLKLMSSLSF